MLRIPYDIKQAVDNLDLKEHEKLYTINFLSDITHAQHCYEEDYIHKPSNYFRKICGKDGDNQQKIIKVLKEAGILEINNSFSKGNFPKSYRSNIELSGRWVTIKIDKYLNKKQKKQYKKRLKELLDIYIQWHSKNIKNILGLNYLELSILIRWFFKIEVEPDKDMILKTMMNLVLTDKENYQRRNLYRIKIIDLITLERNHTKKGSKGGRHYTILSNCPKDIRKCLVSKIKDRPDLIELDIKNSQPTFLLGICNAKNIEMEEGMKSSILEGQFYEEIGSLWGYNPTEVTEDKKIRDQVKKLVYSNIIFATNTIRQHSKYFKAIKKEYPKFCKAVMDLSRGQSLASVLQNAEADLVLPIVKKFGGVGIHDSLIFTATQKDDYEPVMKYIKEQFYSVYKIYPKISVECISKNESF